MQARSALFDLYGDHLRHRGGVAPVSALLRTLAALDIAGAAVRTAVSRMVRQDWLTPTTTPAGPGYALTTRAVRRLDEAAARIYRQRPAQPWDGYWSVLVVEHSAQRTRRDRVQRGLEYLGYRPLQPDTWAAPLPATEAESVVAGEGLDVVEFRGRLSGDDKALVARLYRIDALATAYEQWSADADALVQDRAASTPEAAFAVRSRLVHEWRKFLFRDPGLPRELLPPRWPGDAAAAFFDAESARLLPAAASFVDECLERR